MTKEVQALLRVQNAAFRSGDSTAQPDTTLRRASSRLRLLTGRRLRITFPTGLQHVLYVARQPADH